MPSICQAASDTSILGSFHREGNLGETRALRLQDEPQTCRTPVETGGLIPTGPFWTQSEPDQHQMVQVVSNQGGKA
ncbi:hypothetical protein NQZ68_026810 [Dissostichus eleginoides]|nr:hypothetical protein NQZ68_026810 [Dissostichus eleginoides]